MEYRRLGDSGIEVSAVALGAWAIGGFMWGGADEEQGEEAIRAAVDAGATTIDTAPVYGFGLSESIVGRAIRGMRDRVQIFTKFGLAWGDPGGRESFETVGVDGKPVCVFRDARRDSIIKECEASLKRLNVDSIDLYQQHWPDKHTPVEESMEAVERLLAQGKIRAAGVSNFPVDLLDRARRRVPVVSNQPPYSMLKRDIEGDLVPYCREHGVAILAYSPLERGLLTGKVGEDRRFPPTDHRSNLRLFRPEIRRRVNAFLEEIRPVAERHGATLGQLVINWTAHRPQITSVLVGARNAAQARENAGALGFSLAAGEVESVDAALEKLRLEGD
ncbi:MAG: aldo/keto reductase [Candidatus Eisenbacteria bacterium]|nr:aldo/keto reductase [Candidatus Eisenbacteria bacterium]